MSPHQSLLKQGSICRGHVRLDMQRFDHGSYREKDLAIAALGFSSV